MCFKCIVVTIMDFPITTIFSPYTIHNIFVPYMSVFGTNINVFAKSFRTRKFVWDLLMGCGVLCSPF